MSVAINDTPTPLEVTSAAATSATKSGSDCNIIAFDAKNKAGVRQEIKSEPQENVCTMPAKDTIMTTDERLNDIHGKIRLTPTINLMATPNPVNPKRKFVCPYENCTKSYGKSSHLRSHLTWHTGIKPFVCQVANCGKGFTRSDELNRHFRTHTGEKPFECVQCSKKFSRSDHLTKHLATHAKQMMNNSKKPRSQSSNSSGSSSRRVKREIDHEIQFSDGMHFMAALVGNCDQTEVVPNHESAEKTESEDLTKEIPVCHLPIKIKLERPDNSEDYHVVSPPPSGIAVTQTTPSDAQDEIPPEIIVPASTLICPPFAPKIEFNDSSIMPEVNPQPLSGHGAITRLPQLSKVKAEVGYDPERPFHCNQCTKSFKRHDDLNRHLRTHTGEKPFPCCECERRFMRGDHLKKHLKTHTKLR